MTLSSSQKHQTLPLMQMSLIPDNFDKTGSGNKGQSSNPEKCGRIVKLCVSSLSFYNIFSELDIFSDKTDFCLIHIPVYAVYCSFIINLWYGNWH